MITKLCLWLCLSLALLAIGIAVWFAANNAVRQAISSFGIAIFFALGARFFAPAVIYWNEARENDRDWKQLYPRKEQ